VCMRPMNTRPASVVGGISTATSAFRISFSRTISDLPFDGLFGRGRRGYLDPYRVSDASTAPLIQRHDDPEMVGIEGLAVDVAELLVISRALGVDPVELFVEIAKLAALSRATAPPALG
jgi:hypothetical protein